MKTSFALGCQVLLALCLSTGAIARAALSLGTPFSDHAVLQCDQPLPLWGTADPGEQIVVSFRGQKVKTVAGSDGRWQLELQPIAATAEPAELTVAGQQSLVLHDIVVGEVWLASGQSNMEWPLNLAYDSAHEIATANFPLIRHLKIEHAAGPTPAAFAKNSGWEPASPKTAGGFTAVGYFFARELHRQLGVPVGIIHSSWGGTAIESWLSDEARRATPLASVLEARWKKAVSEWPPERVARYPADMAAWRKADAEAKATNTKNPLPWPQPPATDDSSARPGGPHNAMIVPLQPFALRGVLWYQGESNAERAHEYTELFTALIRSWRAAWHQSRLPFYFVQLPNYAGDDPRGAAWAELRHAQQQALAEPDTGMAVAIDGTEPANLHPIKKQEIGRRLALIALGKVYRREIEWSGPQLTEAVRAGANLRLLFSHAAGLTLRLTAEPAFEIAGADHVFHAAVAKLDGESLAVSSPEASQPVAVRYAWSNAPAAALFNGAGLPAAPFRAHAR